MDALRSRPTLRTSFLAAAALALAWVGPVPAQYPSQRYARNRVDELRQALAVPVIDPTRNPEELKQHETLVRRRVAALRGLGDLRAALMLPQWADEGEEGVG